MSQAKVEKLLDDWFHESSSLHGEFKERLLHAIEADRADAVPEGYEERWIHPDDLAEASVDTPTRFCVRIYVPVERRTPKEGTP